MSKTSCFLQSICSCLQLNTNCSRDFSLLKKNYQLATTNKDRIDLSSNSKSYLIKVNILR